MTRPSQQTFIQRQEIELPADGPDSFAAFQILVRPMFEAVRPRGDQPFFARSSLSHLPDVLMSRAVTASVRFDRTLRKIARSGIDDVLVMTYLSGSFSCEVNGRVRTVEAGAIAFFDLARPFSIQSDAVDNISLHISRHRLADLVPAMNDIHGFVLHSGATRQLLLDHLKTCIEVAPQITSAESSLIGEATIQLVAGALQHAKREGINPPSHAGLASLAEIKSFIEEQLACTDLGPDDLTRAFSLSRASLYRLFEPLGGVSAYILDRRLNRALQAITEPQTTHLRIKQLARDLGFTHPTSFSRAFKKRYGMPPHEVRARRGYPDDVQSAAWRQAMATHLPLLDTVTKTSG
ncbi:helix-turn-helix domain-containing protein [Roseateles toxinivorans]|uniref:helix-turn-helix domain-containing protein n=1 Tax=Roseateles toxinivorans TaxID=270368 RepID=UPI00105DC1E5|nr:helix-turn-helix domain-containing protein [Roseateles toxinivorans]